MYSSERCGAWLLSRHDDVAASFLDARFANEGRAAVFLRTIPEKYQSRIGAFYANSSGSRQRSGLDPDGVLRSAPERL